MSERLIKAAASNAVVLGDGGNPVVPHAALVREAIATLGWGTMTYRCDACSFEWAVWLSLGVEGPPGLRDNGLYVPAPFVLGSCPAWPIRPDATAEERATMRHMGSCDGSMSHVRFQGDREFAPILIPDHAPRFVLGHWHDVAQLVIPTPALAWARRFHGEREFVRRPIRPGGDGPY